MADSITEELEYKECGKEELDWGYEEGKDPSAAEKCWEPLRWVGFLELRARVGDNYTTTQLHNYTTTLSTTGQIATLINH